MIAIVKKLAIKNYQVKNFNWNESKNNLLIKERNISFPDVIKAIKEGDLLGVIDHYNQKKYS
ncbi:hypothetical protein [Geminocystis sp.]|uniref:hypothetical protein n=1 Tax=Geminocystis sp. TaxID=2664100 RepID=UPI0035930913